MTDFAVQRANMVESQLRPSDITDRRILRAFAEVRREAFLPAHLKAVGYMDEDLRVTGAGAAARYLLCARTLAVLIQLARVEPGARVLEVGAGTGYGTAVLARLAGEVIGIESQAELAAAAQAALLAEGVGNARIVRADLPPGHADGAPYDAMVVAGGVSTMPAALLDQLRDGGRLVAIEADGEVGRAVVWHRHGSSFDRRPALDLHAPPLPGFERAATFAL